MTRFFPSCLHRIGVVLLSAVLLLIVVFSLSPASAVSAITPDISDKIQHGLAYTALGFSSFIAFFSLPEKKEGLFSCNLKLMLSSLAFGTLFGLFIEFIQPFFGRNADIKDALADFIGLAAGILIALSLCRVILSFRKEDADAQ